MAKPVDLVLVRHGESEANAANRRSEGGDHAEFTTEFRTRFREWGLTELGRTQIQRVKVWLSAEFPQGFDSHVMSWYSRAVETAYICYPKQHWKPRPGLIERNWGPLEGLSHPLRLIRHPRIMALLEEDPLRTDIPEVESYPDLFRRVEPEIEAAEGVQSKLVIAHQETVLAFRYIIERPSSVQFRDICIASDRVDKLQNGQVIHYSRRNPHTGVLSSDYEWVRMIRPAVSPEPFVPWTRIGRKTGEAGEKTVPVCEFACK